MFKPKLFKNVADNQYRSRFLDDLVVGESFASDWVTVSEADVLRFSAEFDPQYFHADTEAAKESPFQGLIASGAHTFALWNKINLGMNGDIAWIAGVGFEAFRFPNPLRPDVNFRATSELLETRRSNSDPARGVVRHRYELWTEGERCLFTAECIALVHVRPGRT